MKTLDRDPNNPAWVLGYIIGGDEGSVSLGADFEYRIRGIGDVCTDAVYWLADHEPPLVDLTADGPVVDTESGRAHYAAIKKQRRAAATVPAVQFQAA